MPPSTPTQEKPRILDLFCGAGGAAVGYHRAGFEVVGVDHVEQPNYPFDFWLEDAMAMVPEELASDFDAIHASPPCQAFTKARTLQGREHLDLIGPIRELLIETGLPYVIENVIGAPLIDPVLLEGQMFEGLRTQRRRLFETNWPLELPLLRHPLGAPHAPLGVKPKPHEWMHVVGHANLPEAREAMGIDWMSQREIAQAIPPAYTEFIGSYLLNHIHQEAKTP